MGETNLASQAEGTGVCPVCRTRDEGAWVVCPGCRVAHHQECWDYNQGCGNYGCTAAPPTHKIEELEIPPGYWGQEQKECPSCRNLIQAAALRCRQCGAVFSTSRPQDANEFHDKRTLASTLPGLRTKGIWLLVFCVLPCTSTIAGVIGLMWYLSNRRELAAMPAQQSAIPKIALGISAVQTILLAIVIILHANMGSSTP